jgi:hypothetical protein
MDSWSRHRSAPETPVANAVFSKRSLPLRVIVRWPLREGADAGTIDEQ